jgi:tetratricopeptide (TPR) repeat protein
MAGTPDLATVPLRDPGLRDRRGRPYEPAVGPRLKVVLAFLFASVALLGATGIYLLAIRLLEWKRGLTYTSQFTLWMELGHIVVGLAALAPFLFFGVYHLLTARRRPNKIAVRLGMLLFIFGIIAFVTGLALVQLFDHIQLPTGTATRSLVYFLHVLTPVIALVLYVLHRRAGPALRWGWGTAWGGGVVVFVGAMIVLHSQDPRRWYAEGPKEGVKYFFPSEARTADGKFLSAKVLMMDNYCLKCHPDVYNSWFHSAQHFSSFNNPPYLFSVRETREVALKRDGNVKASRWCAGCHDPVPFLSGAFDDPHFDDVKHETAHAGITCTVCHAITHIDSTMGNAAYTIEEPPHYPFATSDNALLQWVNNQMIKAKPDFHKKTFLKDFHKTPEFCSTCHKVSLPPGLNHYKEFLRGQNHYDTFLLSGVSGHGARSFYYPPLAKTNCAECHMPLEASGDFGSRDFDQSGIRKIHSHFFPAANTGLPFLMSKEQRYQEHAEGFLKAIQRNSDFLRGTDPDGKDKKVRIDLFGLKEGGAIDGRLLVLRPILPSLKPGGSYLVEVVIRTLNIGHPFQQGTADSNEVWVDFEARSGERVLGRNGAPANKDDSGPVDEWAHFVNVLMLDRHGNRINRRNPQDIFTPLYDKQIPPGTGQVAHYRLEVPKDISAPVELKVRLRYRKFDYDYMALVHKGKAVPRLPIVDLCEDQVTLPVEGVTAVAPAQQSPIKPVWQRWNDYGIGLLLEGGAGAKKGELRQAEETFQHLLTLEDEDARLQGYLNLARVYLEDARLDEAARALGQANSLPKGKEAWWTIAWLSGLVSAQQATDREDFEAAIANFDKIVAPNHQPTERRFNFARDYVVLDELAKTLFKRALLEEPGTGTRQQFLSRAVTVYNQVLALDGEDLDAHFGLSQCYLLLAQKAEENQVKELANPDADTLQALAARACNADESLVARLEAAAQLRLALTAFGKEPTNPQSPKLPALKALLRILPPAYQDTTQPRLQAALAEALGHLHRELHLIYKPDDHARARTTALYRARNPAANHAAEAIVIYPTTPREREALKKRAN